MSRIDEPTSEEVYLKLRLEELQKSYAAAAKPIIDRLVSIERVKLPKYQLTLRDIDFTEAERLTQEPQTPPTALI